MRGMGSGQSVRAEPTTGHQDANGVVHAKPGGGKQAFPECMDLTQLPKPEALKKAADYVTAVMPTCPSAEAQKLLGCVAHLLQHPMLGTPAGRGSVTTLDEKSSRTTRLDHSAPPRVELRVVYGASWPELARHLSHLHGASYQSHRIPARQFANRR